MRTLARFIAFLVMLVPALVIISWVRTLTVYVGASSHMRMGIVIGAAVVLFCTVSAVVNAVIPAKKKTQQRPSSPYAAPASRR
jgi:hypothetical protein